MKIFIFIEWALFHSQSLCYVINIYILHNIDISLAKMILCSAELRIISCLPTHVINLVINDNSLEILYLYIYIYIYIYIYLYIYIFFFFFFFFFLLLFFFNYYYCLIIIIFVKIPVTFSP